MWTGRTSTVNLYHVCVYTCMYIQENSWHEQLTSAVDNIPEMFTARLKRQPSGFSNTPHTTSPQSPPIMLLLNQWNKTAIFIHTHQGFLPRQRVRHSGWVEFVAASSFHIKLRLNSEGVGGHCAEEAWGGHCTHISIMNIHCMVYRTISQA